MTHLADHRTATRELLAAPATLVGFALAGDISDAVGPRSFLHAGPPLSGRTLGGPLLGGVTAGLLFEDEAADVNEAHAIIAQGGVRLSACQDFRSAGPLTGIVTPHTPVALVRREDIGTVFVPLHEGDHGGMRAGMHDAFTLDRLRFLADIVVPVLDAAIKQVPPINVIELQASAVKRGDECHNRNIAGTTAFIADLAPTIAAIAGSDAAPVLEYFRTTPQFFLTLSVAAAKAAAEAIHVLGPRGVVTGLAANGAELGIRVSGLDGWFTTPSPIGTMIPIGDRSPKDAHPLLGDSFITETIGLGGFALTAALTLARTLGVRPAEARAIVSRMRQIAVADSPIFELPGDDFRGAPAGIDVCRVVQTGITPVATVGYMHREPGRGRVGVGIQAVPLDPFEQAARALADAETGKLTTP